jgi:2-dehydro-3-deoxyphosphooctonate aldolase (KDO 8-P synthase)
MEQIIVGKSVIGKGKPLALISGPCVIESREHTFECVERLLEITAKRNVSFIFKASYDKANRSSHSTFRGPGIEEGLSILAEVREKYSVPILSDVHVQEQVHTAAKTLDILQIPAFLCRQTDLLMEAASTGKPLLIKKGQFVSPWEMGNMVEKSRACGNNQVILCERGACFGYNNLVSDMRSLAVMQTHGVPVAFDATHSTQLPGSLKTHTGGQREFIPLLARAAVASGVQALFMETHPFPEKALSDSATVFPLDSLGSLLDTLIQIHNIVLADIYPNNPENRILDEEKASGFDRSETGQYCNMDMFRPKPIL